MKFVLYLAQDWRLGKAQLSQHETIEKAEAAKWAKAVLIWGKEAKPYIVNPAFVIAHTTK